MSSFLSIIIIAISITKTIYDPLFLSVTIEKLFAVKHFNTKILNTACVNKCHIF